MLVLNLGFDSLTNVYKDYSLYPVWARGPGLALASKKAFQAQRHVSILVITRGCRVQSQAHHLLPRAGGGMFRDRLLFATRTDYGRV